MIVLPEAAIAGPDDIKISKAVSDEKLFKLVEPAL